MENYAGLIELIFVFVMLGVGWLVLDRQGRYLEAFVIAGFAAGIAAVASLMIRRQARGMTAAA